MEWEDGGEVQEGGMCVYLWLIHVAVWQKPTQYCIVIILQLKINIFLKKKEIVVRTQGFKSEFKN